MNPPSQPRIRAAADALRAGAHPAKQARSRELRDRLVASGHVLIEQGGFAGTSMADIARAAGCSVGALYMRFRDKEALFQCVAEVSMAQALEAMRQRAAAGRYAQPTLEATIAAVVEDHAGFVAGNKGMIRALYERALQEPRYWTIVRSAGYEMVTLWTAAIAASAGREHDAAFARQVRIALRYVNSVLVYSALLVEPPSALLTPQEQLYWLTGMAHHIITAPPPVPGAALPAAAMPGLEASAAAHGKPKSTRAAPARSKPASRPSTRK